MTDVPWDVFLIDPANTYFVTRKRRNILQIAWHYANTGLPFLGVWTAQILTFFALLGSPFLLPIFLGMTALGVFIPLLATSIWHSLLLWRLQRNGGKVIFGRIQTISLKSPSLIWGGDHELRITYSFVSPTGRRLYDRKTKPRNDLRWAWVKQSGSVAVLYFNDQNWMLL